MAENKKSPWARMGDMKQLDYATVGKMDPDQPNLYYGTEEMADIIHDPRLARKREDYDRAPIPNETIESKTRRVVNADTAEDVARRRKDFWSVTSPLWKNQTSFPYTKFSPALGDVSSQHGATTYPIPSERSTRNPSVLLPANSSPLTTALTTKHEMLHVNGYGHVNADAVNIMSAPMDNRGAATKYVLKQLMDQGVPEDEAAAMITNDLESPRDVRSVMGLHDYESNIPRDDEQDLWGDYVRKAAPRLMTLRKHREKNRKKEDPLDLYSRTTSKVPAREPVLLDLMDYMSYPTRK